jgi:hypothetical protein
VSVLSIFRHRAGEVGCQFAIYETKLISSFVIKETKPERSCQFNPPKDASLGTPILVRVTLGEKKAEVKLMVFLTGIYKLDGKRYGNPF